MIIPMPFNASNGSGSGSGSGDCNSGSGSSNGSGGGSGNDSGGGSGGGGGSGSGTDLFEPLLLGLLPLDALLFRPYRFQAFALLPLLIVGGGVCTVMVTVVLPGL